MSALFPYDGPPELQRRIVDALTRVVDPQVALSIVEVGLFYGVQVTPAKAPLRMTMTSVACPVADLIIDEAETEFDRVLRADMAIHVFIVSVVMGHAPVILPAVAGVKLHYGRWFYAPLALLHLSLVLRLGDGFSDNDWRSTGASLNALALLLFALTLAGSALAWRRHHAPTKLSHRTP